MAVFRPGAVRGLRKRARAASIERNRANSASCSIFYVNDKNQLSLASLRALSRFYTGVKSIRVSPIYRCCSEKLAFLSPVSFAMALCKEPNTRSVTILELRVELSIERVRSHKFLYVITRYLTEEPKEVRSRVWVSVRRSDFVRICLWQRTRNSFLSLN